MKKWVKLKSLAEAKQLFKDGIISRGKCQFCSDRDTIIIYTDYRNPSKNIWLCKTHYTKKNKERRHERA